MPVHTIVLGQGAASAASAAEIAEEIQKRSLAVDVAGIFARARERGVEPENEEEYEKAMRLANEYGKMNTEFHYAYELVDILERISKKTFVFDAPAIVGPRSLCCLGLSPLARFNYGASTATKV